MSLPFESPFQRNSQDSNNEKENVEIDTTLMMNFKKVRALKEKRAIDHDMQGFDSAFYSTDDESGNERSFVDNIMRECQNLPLNVKKQLQVIKEESEHDMQEIGFGDQMDMMGDK